MIPPGRANATRHSRRDPPGQVEKNREFENFSRVPHSLCYTPIVASEKRFSEVRKMLSRKGYTLARIAGSHHVFLKPGESPVSIPVHKGKVKSYYVRKIEKL